MHRAAQLAVVVGGLLSGFAWAESLASFGLHTTDASGCHLTDGRGFEAPTIVLMAGAYDKLSEESALALKVIDTAIASGCDIDEPDELGMSPLNAAILYNEPILVQQLPASRCRSPQGDLKFQAVSRRAGLVRFLAVARNQGARPGQGEDPHVAGYPTHVQVKALLALRAASWQLQTNPRNAASPETARRVLPTGGPLVGARTAGILSCVHLKNRLTRTIMHMANGAPGTRPAKCRDRLTRFIK